MASREMTPAELVNRRLPSGRCIACGAGPRSVNSTYIAIRVDTRDPLDDVHRASPWPDGQMTVAAVTCDCCGHVMFLLKNLPGESTDEPSDEHLPDHR